jgi:hypothetical protein
VVTFWLDQFDESGNVVQQIPVEMRGRSFHGVLADGHAVEVEGRWGPDGTLHSKRLRNLFTGGGFSVKSGSPAWAWIVTILFIVAFLAFAGWAFATVRGNHDGPTPSATGHPSPSLTTTPTPNGTPTPTPSPTPTASPTPTEPVTAVVECAPPDVLPSSGTTAPGPDAAIPAGGRVQWVNSGTEPLDLSFNEPAPPDFVDQSLEPGAEFTFTFEEPGTFQYICAFSLVKVVGNIDVGSP